MLIDEIQVILCEVGEMLLSMRARGDIQGKWQATQLKSEADLIAESHILRRLNSLNPMMPIVSEEDLSSHAINRLGRYWLVDPIDGTASFCGGYSGFVSQIALMDGAQPLLGAVYAPDVKMMYVAERGGGAYANGIKLNINLLNSNIILTDNYPEPRGIAKLLHAQLPCSGYLESGSIGLKICLVADGQADLFVKDVTVRNWDLAPAHLILRESGGILVDLHGREINYGGDIEQNGGLIAAAQGLVVDRVTNFLMGATNHDSKR